MKTYTAYYYHKDGDVCSTVLRANNIKDANQLAQFHKRHTPEVKKCKTEVKLKKQSA